MKFEWIIDAADKTKYRAFVAQWKSHRIVKEREKRNLQRIGIDLTPRNFWRKLAGCLGSNAVAMPTRPISMPDWRT